MASLAERFPDHVRAPIIETALIVFMFAVGILIGVLFFHTHIVRQTTVRHVQRSWGTPDSTVDGAQVNPSLAGYRCDIYSARKTVVCHP